MRLIISLVLLITGCSSAERSQGPKYGFYDMKIQIFHSESIFNQETIECVDLTYMNRVNLVFIDRTDVGGWKYFEGTINVSSSSSVECHDSSKILFSVYEVEPRKVAVYSYVDFSNPFYGNGYFIAVTPSFYEPYEYAPVYSAGEKL